MDDDDLQTEVMDILLLVGTLLVLSGLASLLL